MTRDAFLTRFPHASEACIRANCDAPPRPAACPQGPAAAPGHAPAPAALCARCGETRGSHHMGGQEHPFEPRRPATAQGTAPAPKPKRKRVERTRNGGTLTEAAYWGMLRSGLRRTFRWWKPALAALKAARVPYCGPRGQKWAYLCADCGKLYLRRQVQIDHVEACGALTSLDHVAAFVARLTPEAPEAFQICCRKCHQKKTNKERIP